MARFLVDGPIKVFIGDKPIGEADVVTADVHWQLVGHALDIDPVVHKIAKDMMVEGVSVEVKPTYIAPEIMPPRNDAELS